MKKYILLGLSTFYIQLFFASTNSLTIINQSSDQISITLQTAHETVTQSVLPNENHTVNTMNNSVLTSTSLSYTASPIRKISIKRISTNLPQIIYYNSEVTVDQHQQPTGIYSINLGKPGTILISQDSVIINNQSYTIIDLQSCIVACNKLNSQIGYNNIDTMEKQIDDIAQSLISMQGSDKNSEIESQLVVIQSQIDLVKNNIKIMKILNDSLQKTVDLMNNISDQNVDQIKNIVQSLDIQLYTIMQSPLQGNLYTQGQALKNNIHKLKTMLSQHGVSFQATNYEFLIPYNQDISTGYQQIGSQL